MSIDVASPGASAASLGLAMLKLVLPANAPVTPSNSDDPSEAPLLGLGITYVQQGATNFGAILLPSAVSGALVVLLNANSAGNWVSVLTQEGDMVNSQFDQVDWDPVPNYADMPAPLVFYSPADGQWWSNGQLD